MSKPGLAICSLLFVTATAVGQTGEYGKLREWLGVSPATIILSSSQSKLPAGSLKVYLATGKDENARSYYASWVEKWNRNEGQKAGLLEVVSDLSQADLIIARFKGDTAVEQRGSIGTVSAIDMKSRPTTNSRMQVYRPLYAYLIMRTPDALEVVYRHVDRNSIPTDPDGNLLDELKKKIKRR